jgi:hypothetical protein
LSNPSRWQIIARKGPGQLWHGLRDPQQAMRRVR